MNKWHSDILDILGHTQIQKERGRFSILLSEWYSPFNGSEVDKCKSNDLALVGCRHTTTPGNCIGEALQNARSSDEKRMYVFEMC